MRAKCAVRHESNAYSLYGIYDSEHYGANREIEETDKNFIHDMLRVELQIVHTLNVCKICSSKRSVPVTLSGVLDGMSVKAYAL